MKIRAFLIMLLITLSSSAYALESFTGKVTIIEPSYLPGTVVFMMDAGNATCPAGGWLTWQNASIDNNKAIYSGLMAALMSGKKVTFVINDGDVACKGQNLHLTNN